MAGGNQQDVTNGDSRANPFSMSNKNKSKDKACSINFKAQRGVDKDPERHYTTTFKEITSKARSNTVQQNLPALNNITIERAVNSTRNNKVSVMAMNSQLPFEDYPAHLASKTPHSKNQNQVPLSKRKKKHDQLRDSIADINRERIQA